MNNSVTIDIYNPQDASGSQYDESRDKGVNVVIPVKSETNSTSEVSLSNHRERVFNTEFSSEEIRILIIDTKNLDSVRDLFESFENPESIENQDAKAIYSTLKEKFSEEDIKKFGKVFQESGSKKQRLALLKENVNLRTILKDHFVQKQEVQHQNKIDIKK